MLTVLVFAIVVLVLTIAFLAYMLHTLSQENEDLKKFTKAQKTIVESKDQLLQATHKSYLIQLELTDLYIGYFLASLGDLKNCYDAAGQEADSKKVSAWLINHESEREDLHRIIEKERHSK